MAGAAREGGERKTLGFHPGQAPKRACGPRRLLAYMEDTWRHCGISNTWSMPLLGKNIGAQISDFGWLPSKWAIKKRKGWKNPLQLSQEISIKIKMTQNHWVVLVPFPSNSHCSHSRRRFCLRSGFDAWFVPRSIVTKKKISPRFFSPTFWLLGQKRGGSKLLNYRWIRGNSHGFLVAPCFPVSSHPPKPRTAAVTSIRISSEVEPQSKTEKW